MPPRGVVEVGANVLVKFPDDECPDLWQECYIVGHVAEDIWVGVSPDEDYEKVGLGPEGLTYRKLGRHRALPSGVAEEECYLVWFDGKPRNYWTAAELAGLREQGRQWAII